jgi:hypothetical protein
MLVGAISFSAMAFNFDLPTAAKAPVIDGKINADEWAGALTRNIGLDYANKDQGAAYIPGDGTKEQPASGVVKLMWDSKYIYACGEYIDKNLFFQVEPSGVGLAASAATNVQDAFQLVFDPKGDGETSNDLSIIDFTMTPDGKGPMYWQHWGDPRREFPGIKMSAAKTAKGFAFEAAIPWADFEEDYVPKKGDILGNVNCVDDYDEGSGQIVIGDGLTAPWADPTAINRLTLK